MMYDLENNWNYHPVDDDDANDYLDEQRETFKNLATFVDDNLPESREKSMTLTKLEEALMWANAAIARNQE